MEQIWLSYIVHFIITLIAGSLFCIGLFHSTEGKSSVKPDGTESTDFGMIFYPIAKFLSQKNTVTIYYVGWQLDELCRRIKCDFRQHELIVSNMKCNETEIEILDIELVPTWELFLCDIEKKYKVSGFIEDGKVYLYEQFEENVFSEWWTKPLLLCYKCYASIWGTLIFTLMTLFSIKTGLIEKDFSVLIPMWIIYVFSLVVANMYVYKKIN
jgi:hypothetical protein